ncbi:rod shape-determining protein MreD [Williamwhitmania taraxaci]|uniref:Rod shape-determining protein MreD n=1 Tax=Williamwhitmania taraxaci TaxID=1640674 RepID=A0A1G6HZQ2_9BACT|nr:rod shape-determining protein MreD [Williamwhitmania taraxaci]SDB99752.1 rod shape-determining protein MreD [Williamwhitmania taraxaci]
MIKYLLKYFGLFVLLVLLQEFFFSNIQLSGYLNPYVYILFVLMLPLNTPRWIMLVTAFLLGLSVDLFANTLGFHAFATTLLAFIRPNIIALFSNRDDYNQGPVPTMAGFGLPWFLRYAGLCILIHHFTLFYLEAFTFHGFFFTFLRVILSSVFTLVIIVLSQLLFYKE